MCDTSDRDWLIKAIELSRQCPTSQNAFSVGAIIVSSAGDLISTGFSRERVANEHAEETAIKKAQDAGKTLTGATIYSSLEPCYPRLSGKKSCTDLIIEASFKRVVFALYEPPTFVVCNGTAKLREHGIDVDVLSEFATLVEEINQQEI
jgi:diaminohydroxyphosphoribosylaminopyrimidine deaminase/5-amino-6-(5-phosphoribosylamino)uracil reductase